VLSAGSPEQAMDVAAGHAGRLDMLVTDIVMPGMNGRTLAEKLVEAEPNLKCLFVSGYSDGVMGADGMIDEDLNFLQKPFSPRTLARKVRQVLEA
jgi:DNA-binding NtrC family response regulator